MVLSARPYPRSKDLPFIAFGEEIHSARVRLFGLSARCGVGGGAFTPIYRGKPCVVPTRTRFPHSDGTSTDGAWRSIADFWRARPLAGTGATGHRQVHDRRAIHETACFAVTQLIRVSGSSLERHGIVVRADSGTPTLSEGGVARWETNAEHGGAGRPRGPASQERREAAESGSCASCGPQGLGLSKMLCRSRTRPGVIRA
jgi:hypothetical protein